MTVLNPAIHRALFLKADENIIDFGSFYESLESIVARDFLLSGLTELGHAGYEITETAPTDQDKIWIDPAPLPQNNPSAIKIFNTATSAWEVATFELYCKLIARIGAAQVVPNPPSPKNIWVDAVNGDNITADHTQANPYKTLFGAQASIANIALTNDLTIHVAPGTYNEAIRSTHRNSDRITIKGEAINGSADPLWLKSATTQENINSSTAGWSVIFESQSERPVIEVLNGETLNIIGVHCQGATYEVGDPGLQYGANCTVEVKHGGTLNVNDIAISGGYYGLLVDGHIGSTRKNWLGRMLIVGSLGTSIVNVTAYALRVNLRLGIYIYDCGRDSGDDGLSLIVANSGTVNFENVKAKGGGGVKVREGGHLISSGISINSATGIAIKVDGGRIDSGNSVYIKDSGSIEVARGGLIRSSSISMEASGSILMEDVAVIDVSKAIEFSSGASNAIAASNGSQLKAGSLTMVTASNGHQRVTASGGSSIKVGGNITLNNADAPISAPSIEISGGSRMSASGNININGSQQQLITRAIEVVEGSSAWCGKITVESAVTEGVLLAAKNSRVTAKEIIPAAGSAGNQITATTGSSIMIGVGAGNMQQSSPAANIVGNNNSIVLSI